MKNLKTIPQTACSICRLGRLDFRFTKQEYSHFECSSCKHLQVLPVPEDTALDDAYQEGFGAMGRSLTPEEIERITRQSEKEFPLKILRKLKLPNSSYILDVGCSFGYDLAAIKRNGYSNVYGLEISRKAVTIANQVLKVTAFSTLKALKEKKLRFDFIYLKHNLEHHRDPVTSVRELTELLEPGGYFLVGVPNRFSVNGLWGKRWEWVTPPTHIHFFSKESLKETFRSSGLTVQKFYSRRGHALTFVKHFLFYSPGLGQWASRWVGNSYNPSSARLPRLRKVLEGLFLLSEKVFSPMASVFKSTFLVGEEIWVLGKK